MTKNNAVLIIFHIIILIISLLWLCYTALSGIIVLTLPGIIGIAASIFSLSMVIKKKLEFKKHIKLFLINNVVSIIISAISLYGILFHQIGLCMWLLPLLGILISISLVCYFTKNSTEGITLFFSNLGIYYYLLALCATIAFLTTT
ncbi:MAG: hypothetical protein J6K17_14965 [Oscillospiraceae bacterium]|nr:hypothetical protein [Oscillospiraceae bacterium]